MVDWGYGGFAVCGGGGSEGELLLIRDVVFLLSVALVVNEGEMWLNRVMVCLLPVVVMVLRVRCG